MFSNGRRKDISLNHCFTLGLPIFFHVKAITLFACSIPIFMKIFPTRLMLCPVGYKPSRKNLGSTTSLIDQISCIITLTSSQNSFIFGHDHIQWNNVPLSSPHLLQRSGICILNLLSFSGVMYTLISQLNCSIFRRVLPVCVWA